MRSSVDTTSAMGIGFGLQYRAARSTIPGEASLTIWICGSANGRLRRACPERRAEYPSQANAEMKSPSRAFRDAVIETACSSIRSTSPSSRASRIAHRSPSSSRRAATASTPTATGPRLSPRSHSGGVRCLALERFGGEFAEHSRRHNQPVVEPPDEAVASGDLLQRNQRAGIGHDAFGVVLAHALSSVSTFSGVSIRTEKP